MNVKPVRASIAGYMAKYMSKGGEHLAEALEDWGEENCPRTWWNLSGPMRDAVQAEMLEGEEIGAVVESLVNHALDFGVSDFFHWLRHVELPIGGGLITVGWRGWLKDGPLGDVQSIFGATSLRVEW